MPSFDDARAIIFALITVGIPGCAARASRPSSPAAPPPAASAANTPPATPAPLPQGVPDTTAGHQLAWVLAAMNSAPAEADIASHFSAAFLAQVPLAKLVETAGRVAQGAPYVLENVGPSEDSGRMLVARVRSSQGKAFTVRLGLEPDGDRIEGLLIRPHIDPKVAGSWSEVAETLRGVAPSVSFLAAEIQGKRCVSTSGINPQNALALGSTFKLYVLDALAAQVASGKHRWDDPIAIDDALKSLPSGKMQDAPVGKTFTVRHFAEQMISVSDNTAADHLLAFVGRGAVEAAVTKSGHAHPSSLVPFPSTREMFALKLLTSPDERNAYLAADVAHKRKLLDVYAKRDPTEMLARSSSFKTPTMIDALEWFASPEDLCKLMADLHERAVVTTTGPVGAILSMNPGFPDDAKQYRYIGFKGGSEPGVLNMTFLLERARDDKWLFLTVGFNDTNAPIDEPKALAAVATAREFLGR
jgi:beta-lactamase class A